MKRYTVTLKNGDKLSVYGYSFREAMEGTTEYINQIESVIHDDEYEEGCGFSEFPDNGAGS